MRRLLALLVCGLPLAAWSQEERIVVKVGDQELATSALEGSRGDEDVKDFESFLLVNMARRGVCLSKLGSDFFQRLHRVVSLAAAQSPVRFRYFLLMAPQFGEQQITDLFVVLRDAPEGFPSYVADQVRFFSLMAAAPAPQDGGAPAPGETAAPALREAQVSETVLREFRRWQMHCGLFCPGRALTGDPDGNTVDFAGDRRPWDVEGLMKGPAWDAGNKRSQSAPAVSASSQSETLGPAPASSP